MFFQENAFDKVVYKISAMLFGLKFVNMMTELGHTRDHCLSNCHTIGVHYGTVEGLTHMQLPKIVLVKLSIDQVHIPA